MLTYEAALEKILEKAVPLGVVNKNLSEVLEHFVAESIVSPFPMPQFDNSAVDGYGVLCADFTEANEASAVSLKLLGEIQAGSPGSIELQPRCAIKIFTGAVVPPSVESVVMREYCAEADGSVSIQYAPSAGENIRRRGAEFEAGKEILSAGFCVTPPVVGLLATLGKNSVKTFQKPSVCVIATGDELIEPGQPLAPGQIYNSNSYALSSALHKAGVDKIEIKHARDNVEATRQCFSEALKDHDVIISTGGVSVGDYDYVKDVLEQLGVETVFWRIAIKPGKPVYFGVQDEPRKLVFGLPGNPVSGLVTYHQFVKPALLKLMGASEPENKTATAVLMAELRKKPGRLDFVRGVASASADGRMQVTPTVGQDSHMMSGLAKANCLIHFDADASILRAGEHVVVTLLNWSV